MKEIRPYHAHELDVHPNRDRILATLDVGLESERKTHRLQIKMLSAEIERLNNEIYDAKSK